MGERIAPVQRQLGGAGELLAGKIDIEFEIECANRHDVRLCIAVRIGFRPDIDRGEAEYECNEQQASLFHESSRFLESTCRRLRDRLPHRRPCGSPSHPDGRRLRIMVARHNRRVCHSRRRSAASGAPG